MDPRCDLRSHVRSDVRVGVTCIVDTRVLVGARDHEAAAAAQHTTDRTQGLTWLAGSGELTHTHCSVERRVG